MKITNRNLITIIFKFTSTQVSTEGKYIAKLIYDNTISDDLLITIQLICSLSKNQDMQKINKLINAYFNKEDTTYKDLSDSLII